MNLFAIIDRTETIFTQLCSISILVLRFNMKWQRIIEINCIFNLIYRHQCPKVVGESTSVDLHNNLYIKPSTT